MPCWDSYLFSKESKEKYLKEFKENQCAKHQDECSDIKHLESRIHNLTEMLCSLCKKVESAWPSVFLENTELSAWWKDHKASDQAIKELEEVRSLKKQKDRIPDASACCFNCKHWLGKRRKDTAYCMRLNLGGIDAPSGDSLCVLWVKRLNARSTPNAEVDRQRSPAAGGDAMNEPSHPLRLSGATLC